MSRSSCFNLSQGIGTDGPGTEDGRDTVLPIVDGHDASDASVDRDFEVGRLQAGDGTGPGIQHLHVDRNEVLQTGT